MPSLQTVQFLVLAAILLAAVVLDLRERRIPNKITLPGLLVGLALGVGLEGGIPLSAMAGAGVALFLSFPFVALGGLGAGDSKLLTAVGAFVGPGALLPVAFYGAVAGAGLAVLASLRRGSFLGLVLSSGGLLVYLVTFGRRGHRLSLDTPGAQSVPYAVAIALGAVAAWFFPFSLGTTV
ncbi:prepilin peptidase [Gemmatimonadota bacterium]